MVPTNARVFLRGLKMQRKQNLASALGIEKKIGGNHAFFRDNKVFNVGKMPHIALYFTAFLNYCCLITS